MNKILLYLTILAGVAIFGACNLNESPEFNDAEAFVAFGGTRFSVTEDAGVLSVPVRLTSLGEVTAAVTFEVIDSTAVAGRDFELSGGASVLNFDGSDPVQHIDFNILPHEGEFTGDLVFGIVLKSAGNVNLGSNDTVYTTILDIDHPLASILGAYTGSGDDAFGSGVYSWGDVVFEKDETDISKVWIRNVFSGYAVPIDVYGVVNEEKTEISVPVHQAMGVVSGYNAYFEGAEIPFSMLSEGDKLTFTIDGNTVALEGPYQAGVGAYNATTAVFAGWFERVSALTFTKK